MTNAWKAPLLVLGIMLGGCGGATAIDLVGAQTQTALSGSTDTEAADAEDSATNDDGSGKTGGARRPDGDGACPDKGGSKPPNTVK